MVVDLWLPGYTRVDLGLPQRPYDEMGHPKLGWHTTEGTSLTGARAAFRPYPPHLCYDPVRDIGEQYLPIGVRAFAFAGDENDDEYVIQVEVVGFAAQSHTWSDQVCERLYRRVVAPLEVAIGLPRDVVPGGFHRQDEGIVLASRSSPVRLSSAQLRRFSGHLGHQHMPGFTTEGARLPADQHWDPGGLPIDRILAHAATPTQEDDMATKVVRGDKNTATYVIEITLDGVRRNYIAGDSPLGKLVNAGLVKPEVWPQAAFDAIPKVAGSR